jgi:hypothetical protein
MRCLLFAILLLSVSSLASQSLPLSPDWSSQGTPSLSQKLNDLASTLEQATSDSQSDWETLSQVLTDHSKKLAELAASSKDSELEMASIKKSLDNYDRLLTASIQREKKARLSNRSWRIGGLVAGGVSIGALVSVSAYGTRPGAYAGAIVGAGAGLLGALLWDKIESNAILRVIVQ